MCYVIVYQQQKHAAKFLSSATQKTSFIGIEQWCYDENAE
jgi:hypothetical protein